MKTACGIDRIVIDAAGGFDREAITGDVILMDRTRQTGG